MLDLTLLMVAIMMENIYLSLDDICSIILEYHDSLKMTVNEVT